MRYFYSKQTGGFYVDSIHGNNIPDDAVSVTKNNYNRLLDAQASGQVIIGDKNGRPKAVNADSLKTRKDVAITEVLVREAKKLITANEYRWNNQIKWQRYDDKTRDAVMKYYDALVAVVNGESDTIPTLEIE